MKVRTATATGCPVPQFIVEPETEADKMLLHAFFAFPGEAKDKWNFHLHGWVRTDGEVSSFNFGWIKAPPVAE